MTFGQIFADPLLLTGFIACNLYIVLVAFMLDFMRNIVKNKIFKVEQKSIFLQTCINTLFTLFCLPVFLPLLLPVLSYSLVPLLPNYFFSKDNWGI